MLACDQRYDVHTNSLSTIIYIEEHKSLVHGGVANRDIS